MLAIVHIVNLYLFNKQKCGNTFETIKNVSFFFNLQCISVVKLYAELFCSKINNAFTGKCNELVY